MTIWDDLERPVAFVLSGGASNGAVHAGMLRAVEDSGLLPDLVAGTSVGALNGAILANDPAGAAGRLTTLWSDIRRESVFSDGLITRARNLWRSRRFIYSNEGLRRLIHANITAKTVEELRLPFAAVATDVMAGHATILDSGPLEPVLLASAALPGVFPNIVLNGRLLTDGGMTANAPVDAAAHLGAASMVVFDAGFACHLADPPRHLAARVLHAMSVMLRHQVERHVVDAAERCQVVMLPALCPLRESPFDFGHVVGLIAEAYETSTRFLSNLELDGHRPGLYGRVHRHEPPSRPRDHETSGR